VIIEIDAGCFTSAAIPSKDKSPLAVDADRVKSLQFAAQFLELGGARKSRSVVASSSICSLRKSRFAKSAGMFRE
jgi:hypothetical protein